MKKIGLLILVVLGFAQVCNAVKDYSEMSTNELIEALVAAVKENNQDAVKQLLQAGANAHQEITYTKPQYDDYDIKITCTLLEYAAGHGYVNIVKELIKAKLETDDFNKALIFAARKGHADIVRELIKADAHVDINKALISAAEKGRVVTVRELIKADAHANESGGLLGFLKNFFNVNHAKKKHLDKALARTAGNLEYIDLENGLKVIKLLIQAGADVNHTDKNGDTPLILAIREYLMTEEQMKDRAEIIQVMLQAGANVNHVNKQGEVALIIAIRQHDFDAVQILLKAPGIDINYVDNDENTPLIFAVDCVQTTYIPGRQDQYNNCINSQNIIKILLETPGINVYHANKNGNTAIKLLERRGWY